MNLGFVSSNKTWLYSFSDFTPIIGKMIKPLIFSKSFLIVIFFLLIVEVSVFADETQKTITEKHHKTAFSLSQRLADQGNNAAQFNLGLMYFKGDGVKQNFPKAAKWYRLSAIQGNAEAQFKLGNMYYNGDGIPIDHNRAAKWYFYSSRKGNIGAQFNLGSMFEKGEGVSRSYKKAMRWYKIAANKGHAYAQYKLGVFHEGGLQNNKNFDKALKWFLKAANNGNSEAQFKLGEIYDQRIRSKKNKLKAFEWYSLAAKKGLPKAQFHLGSLYENGDGVKKDLDKAANWYLLSAEQGYIPAQKNIAWMYLNGIGVVEDSNEADKWYKKVNLLGTELKKEPLKNLYSDLYVHKQKNKKISFEDLYFPEHITSTEKNWLYKNSRVSLAIGSWISRGETSWNHDASGTSSVAGNPTSELTYEDLDSQVIEVEVDLKLPNRVFLRSQFGFGSISNGRLVDDDFVNSTGATFFGASQSGAHRISRTFSDVDDDSMWYLNLDLGFKIWASKNNLNFTRFFMGYQHWEEKVAATGIEQVECSSVGNFCNSPGTITNKGQKIISNEAKWDSLRVGWEGFYHYGEKLRFDINLAYIPISKVLNRDTHHLRADLQKNPSFEMDGTGTGYNLEADIKYFLTKSLLLSTGYKYWKVKVSDGTWKNFPVVGNQTEAKLNDLFSFRHGVTAKLEYLF